MTLMPNQIVFHDLLFKDEDIRISKVYVNANPMDIRSAECLHPCEILYAPAVCVVHGFVNTEVMAVTVHENDWLFEGNGLLCQNAHKAFESFARHVIGCMFELRHTGLDYDHNPEVCLLFCKLK